MKILATIVALVLLGITVRVQANTPIWVRFGAVEINHSQHQINAKKHCATCHPMIRSKVDRRLTVAHKTCSMCHKFTGKSNCTFCHKPPEHLKLSLLSEELQYPTECLSAH